MTYRIVDGEARSEAVHHALDEVLLDRLDRGEIDPTLRVWDRERPAVPLGRFQAYADEVATDYVESRDVDVVRRITGGGAMYVEPGDVITVSLYLPRSAVPDDVATSYEVLNEWMVEGLRDVGLDAAHEPLNDISHPDGKLGGAAQLRKEDAVLHHATLSYDLDVEAMLSALRIGEEKVSDKAVASAEQRVAVMRDHVDASREAVVEALLDAFRSAYGGEPASLAPETVAAAADRAAETFATEAWTKRL
ncbi:MAG: biotin/lipoate A/B protein ligase family protein [Halobacteriaceae archaeon]